MWNNLRSGLTDVGVAVSSDVEAGALSLPVRTTTYVMLAGRERPCGGTGLSGTVGSGRVVMPEGFTRTASYAGLLDSLAGAQLYISPLNVYELAAGLARGESDFLICEQGEAAVVGEFVPGLATVYEFAERVDISMVFSPEKSCPVLRFRALVRRIQPDGGVCRAVRCLLRPGGWPVFRRCGG